MKKNKKNKKVIKKASSKKVVKKSSTKSKPAKANVKQNKNKEFETKSQKLITKGRERGFVTYDEILREFPNVEQDIGFLDDCIRNFL